MRHTGTYVAALLAFAVPFCLFLWASWYRPAIRRRLSAGTVLWAILISTPVPAFLLLTRVAERLERVTLGAESVTFHYRDRSTVQLNRGEVTSAGEFRGRLFGLRSARRIRFVIGRQGATSLETPDFSFPETSEIMRRLALSQVPVKGRYQTWVLK